MQYFPTFCALTARHPRLMALIGFVILMSGFVLWLLVCNNFFVTGTNIDLKTTENALPVENHLPSETPLFVTYESNIVSGTIVELSKKNSFIRIFDTANSRVYTINISNGTTIVDEYNEQRFFADFKTGDTVTATSLNTQSAFEFTPKKIVLFSTELKVPEHEVLPYVAQ